MMKRGNKKGQFYLISAVVLAMLITGIFTISNYSKKESVTKMNYLKEEIQTESAHLMDYVLYNELSQAESYNLLLNFTKNYINSQKKNMDLYFVFGNENNITVTGYQKTAKQVSVVSGSSSIITEEAGEFNGGINPEENSLTLYIDDGAYEFDLEQGENFYFVLSQKINKGGYILIG